MINKDYVRVCIANMKKRLRDLDEEVYAIKQNLYTLEENILDREEEVDDLFYRWEG